jgi:hypothetical protein
MMLAIDAQMLRLIDETYEYALEMKEECAPIIWTEEDDARAEHHKKVMAKMRAEEDDTEKRLATVRAKITAARPVVSKNDQLLLSCLRCGVPIHPTGKWCDKCVDELLKQIGERMKMEIIRGIDVGRIISWEYDDGHDPVLSAFRLRVGMYEEQAHISNPQYVELPVRHCGCPINESETIPDIFLASTGYDWLRGYSGTVFYLVTGVDEKTGSEIQIQRGYRELRAK